MKLALLVLLIFLTFSIYSQEQATSCDAQSFYPNGQLLEKRSMVDSLCKIENWYYSGQYKSVYYEKEGLIMKRSLMYCENGQLMFDFQFTEIDSVMEYKVFYCNGSVSAIGQYIRNTGYFIGKYEEFFENGNIKINGRFKEAKKCSEANIKEGIWETFDIGGTVIKKEEYSDGLLIKTW